jgi:hypothetical protein
MFSLFSDGFISLDSYIYDKDDEKEQTRKYNDARRELF